MSYDSDPPTGIDSSDAGFPRSSAFCHIVSCTRERLARRAKPTRDALVEAPAGQLRRDTPMSYGLEAGTVCRVWLKVIHRTVRADRLRDSFRASEIGIPRLLGKNYVGHPRGRRLGPHSLLQGSDATDLLQPSADRLSTSYWRRPRAGRCASHQDLVQGHSLPASPSPCADRLRCCARARLAWPATLPTTPPGRDTWIRRPPAHGRFTNPAQPVVMSSRNIVLDAIGTTSMCLLDLSQDVECHATQSRSNRHSAGPPVAANRKLSCGRQYQPTWRTRGT